MNYRVPIALLALLLLAPIARSGGGPETTLLVVNANSPASLEIANRWATARDLPLTNIVWLDDVPNLMRIDLPTFRTKIWAPIAAHLKRYPDIDTVVYSADFPYAVDVRRIFSKASPAPRETGQPIASLTGVTYLWSRAMARHPSLVSLTANRYYRPAKAASRNPTAAEAKLAQQAQIAVRDKKHEEAAAALGKLLGTYPEFPGGWYNYACCLAQLGRSGDALKALGSAVEHGWSQADHTAKDPDLASIRKRTEFKVLLERMRTSGGVVEARAFAARKRWGEGPHDRYVLSTMLGYTGPLGNSVPEINAYLAASVAADGTHPDGTFYFPKNGNIRSTARHTIYPTTVKILQALGRKAEIIENAKIPAGKTDVMGAMVGTAAFYWGASKARILPGAICEHLTSFGARYATTSQTKISEFLRHGAAGSSGAVVEPFAIMNKFPHPFIHVYYAQGSSLAEAFYQSVWGPYQLLIVGDPLARPFATFRKVALASPSTDEAWKGTVELHPRVDGEGPPIARIELWVDGLRLASGPPDADLTLDTTTLSDGYHDVRIVAIDATPVATRSYTRVEARIDNLGRTLESPLHLGDVVEGEKLEIGGSAPLATIFDLAQGGRTLAQAGGQGRSAAFRMRAASTPIGLGPTSVRLVANYRDGTKVYGPRISLNVVPSKPADGKPPAAGAARLAGFIARVKDERGEHEIPVPSLATAEGGNALFKSQVASQFAGSASSLEVGGEFDVPAAGSYRLLFGSNAALSVTIDGTRVFNEFTAAAGVRGIRLDLAKGWHTISVALTNSARPWLSAELGGDVVSRPLETFNARHVTRHAVAGETPDVALEGVVKGVFPKAGVVIPAEGVAMKYKKRAKFAAVVVHPHDDGKSPVVWPKNWIVETRVGRSKWKAVDELTSRKGGPGRARRGKNETPPVWFLLEFSPRNATEIRVRLADAAEGAVGPTIDGVEAFKTK